MRSFLLIRIAYLFLGLFLLVYPISLQADEIDLSLQELELSELTKVPKKMTQQEMNDLFGEDPYLGQTSYLQSPDGYSQRETSQKWIKCN